MKKIIGTSLAIALIALFVIPSLMADDVDFLVTATIPAATGVNIVAVEVDAATEEFGPEVTELDFDPMSFDSENGIYRSDVFFAIDVGATGGAGAPDVTVTFGNESSPAGQTVGLGLKSTATFTRVEGGPAPEDQTEVELVAHGPTKLLDELTGGEAIDETEIDGGFLRMRVGIYDGADPDLNTAGGEPFTNADEPGAYTGTLTVSATVD